jgi:hypothetical protein
MRSSAIHALQLFEFGFSLNHFGDDLTEVIDRAMARQALGIKIPRSRLPEAHPSNLSAPNPQPTPDTRA